MDDTSDDCGQNYKTRFSLLTIGASPPPLGQDHQVDGPDEEPAPIENIQTETAQGESCLTFHSLLNYLVLQLSATLLCVVL